jgi:predicted membrane-bound mannosyltransferase/DNA-binding beta-propeller fold protein YncE
MTTYSNVTAGEYTNPLNRWLTKVFPLNWETIIYIVILLLAIFTRFYLLGDRVMSHDESLHTKFSWDLYTNGVFQHTPLMHGPILFHVTALNYFLFGDNDFTARIYPAVLGVLMVMFPLLFRRWIGRWGAILASVMFLISPLILYYNRYIREDTPSIFYTLVMVYCTFMYLNGPSHLRRKARWLYIFSAAMLASLATKEVAFMYIAIFGSVLTLYWLVRMAQYFFKLPGKSLFYFLAISITLGGVAALGMYVVLTIVPWATVMSSDPGSLEFGSFLRWTLAVIAAVVTLIVGPLLWAFRRNMSRIPWLDVALMVVLVVVFCLIFLYIEQRSFVTEQNAAETAAPVVPGEEGAVVSTAGYNPAPLYIEIGVAIFIILLLLYSWRAGWWRKLHRFAEFDILLVMGTLILPWITPFIMKMMGASPMSMPQIAAAVQAAIPFIQFDLNNYWTQVFLSFYPVAPAMAVSIVAGLIWNWKRWLICAAIFHILFVFFFTTVFTNIQGLGTGMIGSLGYWLEQQAVRRGSQPQYYYLLLIMPFYEFLPIIGSIFGAFVGMTAFWAFRRERIIERFRLLAPEAVDITVPPDVGDLPPGEMLVEPYTLDESPPRTQRVPEVERIKQLPILLFISWWAVFNLIAYTLAGEKMPWLGTHMTTPLIFLAGWFFGRIFEKVSARKFWERGWLYLLLIPVLFVALAQVVRPLLFGPGMGGLEQEQLTRTFQWFGGIVIAAIVIYAIYQLAKSTGWTQVRYMVGVSVFACLAFITFRSAWMAAFINYDYPTEFLVYAHGAPANKRVEEQLAEWSQRITGGNDLKFAYDFKISWPGAWYFRNYRNAVFLGESPSPRQMDDAAVVIVGDENRPAVEAALEDRYFRFDYNRLWWPMQDYFNLTAQRINNVLDFSPENVQAEQIRQGLFDIWWNRDYTKYGQAVGRNFNLIDWPVADHMYVFVRKDLASQIWDMGVGDGSALNPLAAEEVNMCSQNWQPLTAGQVFGSAGTGEGQLTYPRQLAVDQSGKVYVPEEFNHRISVFNADGTFDFSFGGQGSGPGQFERPNAVAIGPSGNIYVADTWNYRIQVFTPQGEYVTSWGQRGELGTNAPQQPYDAFWGPRAVAVDSNEQVYVADTGNKRIRVYSPAGQWLRDIGAGGSGIGQLDEPAGLAISPQGLLYVADTWNRRISVFRLDGVPADIFVDSENQSTNSFRVRGWVEDVGNRPYLAIDPAQNLLYVTDPDAGRVLVYDTAGQCVGAFGQLSRESQNSGQFASVGGVVVNADGEALVTDAGSGRVLRFAPFPLPASQIDVLPESVDETTPEVISPETTIEATVEVIAPVGVVEETVENTPEVTEDTSG